MSADMKTVAAILGAISLMAIQHPLRAEEAAAGTYQGEVEGGARWSATIPDNWNGVLVTFGNPRDDINKALLARGFGVGAMFQRPGFGLRPRQWADDQLVAFGKLRERLSPRRVISVGYSGPGLVNTMVSEDTRGLTDGAVIGCSLNVGLRNLFNVHFDGDYTISTLLIDPANRPKLVGFESALEIDTTAAQLRAAVLRAQATPQGRARIALAAGFGMMPDWFDPRISPPNADDYAAQERGQFDHYAMLNTMGFDGSHDASGAERPHGGWPGVVLGGNISFSLYSRWDIERFAGGNISGNDGVDYARLFRHLPNRLEVEALYADAGLDLAADLARLNENAHVKADPQALAWTMSHTVPTGRLRVPTLGIRPISDIAGPQYDSWYKARVVEAGAGDLLRQSFVQEVGHCNFTPAEIVAAVKTVDHRLETGEWGNSADPKSLQAMAVSLDIGPAHFISFTPGQFVSDRDRTP